MIVLIAKRNEPIIKEMHPAAKFTESTKNTSTFKITPKAFDKLRSKVRENGYNPYALMMW
jgi:hypothetical protein